MAGVGTAGYYFDAAMSYNKPEPIQIGEILRTGSSQNRALSSVLIESGQNRCPSPRQSSGSTSRISATVRPGYGYDGLPKLRRHAFSVIGHAAHPYCRLRPNQAWAESWNSCDGSIGAISCGVRWAVRQ